MSDKERSQGTGHKDIEKEKLGQAAVPEWVSSSVLLRVAAETLNGLEIHSLEEAINHPTYKGTFLSSFVDRFVNLSGKALSHGAMVDNEGKKVIQESIQAVQKESPFLFNLIQERLEAAGLTGRMNLPREKKSLESKPITKHKRPR